MPTDFQPGIQQNPTPKKKPKLVPNPAPFVAPKKPKLSDKKYGQVPVGPLPSAPPIRGLIPLGITSSIHDVNQKVQDVTDGHMNLFGTKPKPALIFDVIRANIGDTRSIFDIPRNAREAAARQSVDMYPQDVPTPDSVADPGAAKALIQAQGHPLTPQQKVELQMARGDIGVNQARHRLIEAGVIPRLQVIHDEGDIFNQLVAGGYLTASGLIMGAPILAYQEFNAGKASIEAGSFHPLVHANVEMGKQLGLKTYHDTKAIVTGDMEYLRNNPDAYYNVALLGLGAAGGASRLSGIAAVTRNEGLAAGAWEAALRKPPEPKVMRLRGKRLEGEAPDINNAETVAAVRKMLTDKTGPVSLPNGVTIHTDRLTPDLVVRRDGKLIGVYKRLNLSKAVRAGVLAARKPGYSEATVEALNFTNPVIRLADNLRTNRMRARSEASKEPLSASALRALRFDKAADMISENFSYEAKFRREIQAQRRTQYQAGVHLARQLDTITANAIDATDALTGFAKPKKNALTVGELKAFHVLVQGGDWREALTTMRTAHETWRDAAKTIGARDMANDHTAQLAALKLAEDVLRTGETKGFRPVFKSALDYLNRALDEISYVKIDKLGLDPEQALLRESMEFDVYRTGRPFTDVNKLKTLIKATQSNVDRLTEAKGYVLPGLIERRDQALQVVRDIESHMEPHDVQAKKAVLAAAAMQVEKAGATVEDASKMFGLPPEELETHLKSRAHADVSKRIKANSDVGGGAGYTPEQFTLSVRKREDGKWEAVKHPVGGEDEVIGKPQRLKREAVLDVSIARRKANAEAKFAAKKEKEARANEEASVAKFQEDPAAAMKKEHAKARRQLTAAQRKVDEATREQHPQLASSKRRLDTLVSKLAETEQRAKDIVPRAGQRRVPLRGRLVDVGGGIRTEFPSRMANKFGEYLPEVPSEINHSFTGKGLLSGNIRLDFTNTVARDLGKTIRAAMLIDDYNTKLLSAIDMPPKGEIGKWFAPMRKTEHVSPRIKEMVNRIGEPGLSAEDLQQLTDTEVEAFNKMAYGAKRNDDGTWKLDYPIDEYSWYDTRAYPERHDLHTAGWHAFLGTTYNLIGRPKIFLAPRYLLNTLSNKNMMWLEQGAVWTSTSYAAAVYASKIYGEYATRFIDEQVGNSRSRSYGPASKEGLLSTSMTKLANFMHIMTDMHDRRAAWLYHAWKAGYTSKSGILDLIEGKTPKALNDLNAINRRANKSMVEMGNLSWVEQQNLRHLIFVYPWRSRQALWSVRVLAEHPARSAILAMIGENALEDEIDNEPTWMRRAIKKYLDLGYVITGWTPEGDPQYIGAGQINTFSGLNDLLHPNLANTIGPGGQLFVELVSQRNRFGKSFTGNQAQKIEQAFFDVAIEQQPIKLATERGGRYANQSKIPPFNFSSRGSKLAQINASQRAVALSPGWMDGYGIIFTGGATPRTGNRQKILYDYYQGLDDKGRHDFERKLIFNVLNIQSQMMQKEIPAGVHTAVDVYNETSYRLNQLSKKGGFTDGIPEMMHDATLMGVLQDKGLISKAEATKEIKKIEAVQGKLPGDHKDIRNAWIIKYAGGKQLQQWDQDIKLLHSYGTDTFRGKITRLHSFGLFKGNPTGSQDALYSVGRKVLAYEKRVRDLSAEIAGEPDKVRKATLQSELVTYMNQTGDAPIREGGSVFPSAARLSYSDTTVKEREDHIASAVHQKWSSLDNLDKELLTGRHIDPIVSEGWAALNQRMALEHKRLRPGESLPDGLRDYYIDKIAKQSPAFAADVKFQRLTRAEQLSTYKQIKTSGFSDEWSTLLDAAKGFARERVRGGWVHTNGKPDWGAIRKDWADRLPALQEWIDRQPVGFRRELGLYGGSKLILTLVGP